MTREADWIATLRAECKQTSQNKTATRLGLSPTTINQVLAGTYKGNLQRIEERVRGELMNKTVECPVLGEISARKCLDWQARPFAATNPTRVAVWKACRGGCKHSQIGGRK